MGGGRSPAIAPPTAPVSGLGVAWGGRALAPPLPSHRPQPPVSGLGVAWGGRALTPPLANADASIRWALSVLLSRLIRLDSRGAMPVLVPWADNLNHCPSADCYINWCEDSEAVVLHPDRDYKPGEQVGRACSACCGAVGPLQPLLPDEGHEQQGCMHAVKGMQCRAGMHAVKGMIRVSGPRSPCLPVGASPGVAPAWPQVVVSYGPKSSGELLMSYGFCPPPGEVPGTAASRGVGGWAIAAHLQHGLG